MMIQKSQNILSIRRDEKSLLWHLNLAANGKGDFQLLRPGCRHPIATGDPSYRSALLVPLAANNLAIEENHEI